MYLAPVTLSIVHRCAGRHAGAHCGRSNPTILLRSNFVRRLRVRRRSSNLVALFPGRPGNSNAIGRSTDNPQMTIYGRVRVATRDVGTGWRIIRCDLGGPARSCHKPFNKPMSFRLDAPSVQLAAA
jgi:hypothetical protein